MSTSKTEYLSALLDDEAGAFEQRRLLDELKQDDELSQTLNRYALIGESLRSERSVMPAPTRFLSGIQDAIAEEDVHDTVQVTEKLAKPSRADAVDSIWKYGMAAAVGALSLGVVMTLQQPGADSSPVMTADVAEQGEGVRVTANTPSVQFAAATPSASASVSATTGQPAVQRYAQLDAETRGILKQYVAQHLHYASTTAIVPSVRTVSYENDN